MNRKTNFRFYSRSSTSPEKLAKIVPVDLEIGQAEIVEN